MLAKTKKKILFIAVPVSILMVALIIALCIFFVPRPLVDQLPDEKIISVVRVVRDPYILNGEPPEIELSKEKISLFSNLIKDLKYKKRYNIRRLKYKINDAVYYTIIYDNHTVKLREHGLWVHNNNEEHGNGFEIREMQPNGVFDEIDKLFFEE